MLVVTEALGFNGIAALRTRLPLHRLSSRLLCNIATLIPLPFPAHTLSFFSYLG